jgi:hypothetical protein
MLVDFESLEAQNQLRKCHFAEVVSITAAVIQTHKEIKSAIEQQQTLQAINALNDLERVVRIGKAMAEYWRRIRYSRGCSIPSRHLLHKTIICWMVITLSMRMIMAAAISIGTRFWIIRRWSSL